MGARAERGQARRLRARSTRRSRGSGRRRAPAAGRWLRGYGWRSGDWQPQRGADAARPRRGHAATSGRADRQGLPLALAQLGRARARRRRPRGRTAASSSATRTASRPACCARRRPGASRTRYMAWPDDEYLDAMRGGLKLANARGVTAVHDKDGWLGALRLWQQLERARLADAARLAVDSARPARRRRGARAALGLRQPAAAARLPEGVHGRDARLADGVDARRQRRADHERRGARRDRAPRRGGRASRSPCTRSATARTARRSTRSSRRATLWQPLRPAPADRARAAARARGSPPLRRARRRLLGAVLARAVRPRPRRPLLGRQDRRRLRVPLAARLGRRRRERQRRADRGARPARRHPRRRPAHDRRPRRRGIPSRR